MKIKALSRSKASTTRETKGDLRMHHRNLDPTYHPHQRAREYTRAVTSAKIDRMFAKPFIGALDLGHRDGVTASCTSRNALVPFVSGAADGEIRIWDLGGRTLVKDLPGAHSRIITGMTFANDGRTFYSCADDGLIKSWNAYPLAKAEEEEGEEWATPHGPMATYRSPNVGSFKSIDYHRSEEQFATASDSSVDIWDPERNSPTVTFSNLWGGDDTSTVVRYNPAERNLLGQCSMDRGIGLFDTRSGSCLQKTVLKMRSNCFEWNPMEPMNFVVGNEDHNAYTFDMRKLDRPTMIYKGHVGTILTVNWAPTGREFVTGGYDKTIRIFNHRKGKAREIYHTKRMQHIQTLNYTADNKYIVSGSDDTNLRLWKANASEKIGQMSIRETQSVQYRQALIKKYQHMPTVHKIHTSRKAPKFIKKQTEVAQVQKESAQRKQANRAKYDKTGTDQFVSDRKKVVVKKID
jgi:WD repeat and SOF domain-containing protein 1|eukprot:scaffold3567_cov253-Chaetoceros_neogracile.AAC.2